MKYKLLGVWLSVIFCASFKSLSQPNTIDEVDVILEKVNQYKINNRNDSALFELIALNQQLKEAGKESGYLYIDAGNIYFQLRLDKMARQFYQKAYRIFKSNNDKLGESIVYENLGNLQNRNNESIDSAFIYFERALQLQENEEDKFYSAYSKRALAMLYAKKGDADKAQQLITEAIESIQDSTIKNHPRYRWDVQFIPQQVYLTASDIYKLQPDKIKRAEYFLTEAIRMTRIHGIKAHEVRYLTFLATFYLEQQKQEKAFSTIKEAHQLADSIGYVWGKLGVLQIIRNYYHQTKDSVNEAKANYNYLKYKDQMYNNRNNDDLIIMSNLILQYENVLMLERQQNVILEKDRITRYQRIQNLLLMGILIITLVALVFIVRLYRSIQKRKKEIELYAEELEVSNQTMKALLSVISHDVRSPFNSLLGLTKVTLMEKSLREQDYQMRITMMHDTAAKGLILLDNLLQWVAMQRDKLLIKKETIQLQQLVNETLNELSSVALTQHVTIEQQINATEFYSDRNSLKAIIRNLLTNAIRYSAGKKVFLEVVGDQYAIKISVSDQGPGIPPYILESLFEKADMKKVVAKGSGLGMQIVKQLVTDLGGSITANNLDTGGAQFIVLLSN